MRNKFIALIVATVLVCSIVIPNTALASEDTAFTDVSSMTDEEFFGVWNNGTESWTNPGKLNYGYSAELSGIEECVKKADYKGAKAELLSYLRSRTSGYVPQMPEADYPIDLLIDGVYTNRVTFIDKELSVPTEYEWIEADVSSLLKAVSDGAAAICFHARKKEADIIRIASKESENAPYVDAVINGVKVQLPVLRDIYIRAEDYENENYGMAEEILIRDSGNPIDSDTMIGFIQIDTSTLSADDIITSAKLKLYAKTDAAEPSKLMAFRFLRELDEEADTFGTLRSELTVVSWQGIEGGTDWEWPDGYYSEFWYHFNRFLFLPTLVQAYKETKNDYYAYHTINFILDFIKDKYVGYPRTLEAPIRDESWYTVFFEIINSESMNPDACSAIMKYFWQGADYLKDNFAVGSNWGTTQTKALIGYCAVFPEFRDQPLWMKTARNRVENDISPLILDDGSYIENSNSYAAGTLETLLSVLDYAEHAGLEFSPDFMKKVEAYATFIMDTCDPNGRPVEWGDGMASNQRETILELGELLGNQEFIYFGSEGENGVQASHTSSLYPVGRRAFMRSNWNENATYLFINNYKGNIHGHSDSLHIYLHAYGRSLLVDTGKASYDLENDEIAIWQTYDTEAHNSIEINEKRQENIDRNETAVMDMTEYTDFYTGYSDSVSDARFTRNILFVKPNYFIVSDLLEPAEEDTVNQYKQTWHLPYRANPSIDAATKTGKSNFDNSANILVIPADPQELEADLPIGWGRGDTSSVTKQEYLAYSQEKSGDVIFDTVLLPQKMGVNDDVDIKRLDTGFDKSEVSALEITINNNVARYIISHSRVDELKEYGTSSYDGRMAFFEKNSYGQLKTVSISDGKNLTADGIEIIKSDSMIENLSISYTGKDMYLSSTDENFSAEVYVPEGTENIYLNNTAATLQMNGNYALVGGSVIRPKGDKSTENGEVKFKFDEAKYEKYLNKNGESEKVYALEIEADTVATGGENYDGSIGLPFASDDEVLIRPDYSVKFSKPIKITNYFEKGENCSYVTQIGTSDLIFECDADLVSETLETVPVVSVGNDFYTIYNLKEFYAPTEEKAIISPLEPTGPPDKENNAGDSSGTSGDSSGDSSGNSGGSGSGGSGSGGSDDSSAASSKDNDSEEELSGQISEFTDISGHWAEEEIKQLAEKGILNGVSKELFMPDKTVTRAEFAAMLIRAAGIETVTYDGCFHDVDATDWYADILQTASNLGIMNGFNGYARPTDNVTREEAIKMLVTVCKSYFDMNVSSGVKIQFADNDSISSWAYQYVEQAAAMEIIQGDNEGRFNPRESATRAQAATMLYRVLTTKNS